MALMDILMKRRSVRSYTGEPVSRKNLEKILTAGLIGPTGKGKKPWRFVVVTDPEKLEGLSGMRKPALAAFKTAGAAIAVFGDPGVSDTWVEDCSIAMENMHVMADDLGLGSVWIQSRLREAINGGASSDYARQVLGVENGYELEAVLLVGRIHSHPTYHTKADVDWSFVTWDE